MGLTSRLAGTVAAAAAARPHVLLIEMPGGRAVRRAIEDSLDHRAWRRTDSPGSADLLVLAGPVSDSLAPYVDRVEAQLPGPAARVVIDDLSGVDVSLDHAAAQLADIAEQRRRAAHRPHPPWVHRAADEPAEPGEMAPDGIPLAGGGPDLDGLEMDVLRVPLGAVLPHWPPALVLHTELHGDVVVDARVTWLGHEAPADTRLEHTARVLDACDDVLTLAGDPRRARRVRDVRRRVLADVTGTRTQARLDLERLARRFESWLMTRSLGEPALLLASQLRDLLVPDAERAQGSAEGAQGSAERAQGSADRGERGALSPQLSALSPELGALSPQLGALSAGELRAAVVGRDLGEVRLLVAALSPRLWLDLPVTTSDGQR